MQTRAAKVGPSESNVARQLYSAIDERKPDFESFRQACADPDPSVRLAGVRGYSQLPPPSRDPEPLVARLNDTDDRVRRAAIQGLGLLAEPSSIVPLAQVVESTREPTERALAVDALGRIPADAALQPLLLALSDDAQAVRQRAFGAVVGRVGSTLGCSSEQLEKDPQAVQASFLRHLARGGQ